MTLNEASGAIQRLGEELGEAGYLASPAIATCVHLARALRKPVLVEGPPGVGKTALAVSAARALELPLLRLQCYEGIDEGKALYEWKYSKQLLYTQLLRDQLGPRLEAGDDEQLMAQLHGIADRFYDRAFLQPRPLLAALQSEHGAVLLIDEVDKSDPEFEALLLEVLSDYQVSIPELGTVRATVPPLVFLTSNNSRELSEALKRRCLHLDIPYPDAALESRIVRSQVPEIDTLLSEQLVAFVQRLRELDLRKAPAVSETLDWARSLVVLHARALNEVLAPEWVESTLNVLLKHAEDVSAVRERLPELLERP